MSDEIHDVVVDEADARMRIDRFLANHLDSLSRTRIRRLIDGGRVSFFGDGPEVIISDAALSVIPGQMIRLRVPKAEEYLLEAEPMALDIVYEDDAVIVINKPVGLVVHPAPGHWSGTLVNALLAHCADSLSGIGGVKRPGIVHRIDKDTSGLMVVAKTDAAYESLQAQFADHSVDRAYAAIVWGLPQPTSGSVEGNIGRSTRNRQKMALLQAKGRHAVTHYRVLEILGNVGALVECRLETGRTHQIRVHMTSIGHAIIGDPVYGRARKARKNSLSTAALAILGDFDRQALHARSLGFKHPQTGDTLNFEAEPPSDFKALLNALRSN